MTLFRLRDKSNCCASLATFTEWDGRVHHWRCRPLPKSPQFHQRLRPWRCGWGGKVGASVPRRWKTEPHVLWSDKATPPPEPGPPRSHDANRDNLIPDFLFHLDVLCWIPEPWGHKCFNSKKNGSSKRGAAWGEHAGRGWAPEQRECLLTEDVSEVGKFLTNSEILKSSIYITASQRSEVRQGENGTDVLLLFSEFVCSLAAEFGWEMELWWSVQLEAMIWRPEWWL